MTLVQHVICKLSSNFSYHMEYKSTIFDSNMLHIGDTNTDN